MLSHFFVSLSHTSTFFLLPFYLQGILHYTPTQVGLTVIFFSLVIVCLAPIGGWLADRLGSRMLCTVGSTLTAASMVGFALLGSGSSQTAVMAPLMLLGLGWSLFQSPNLSGMFNAVEPRHIGSVSGLSLTSANIANAMGVAVGSVLFMRWLNYLRHGERRGAAAYPVGRQCRDCSSMRFRVRGRSSPGWRRSPSSLQRCAARIGGIGRWSKRDNWITSP